MNINEKAPIVQNRGQIQRIECAKGTIYNHVSAIAHLQNLHTQVAEYNHLFRPLRNNLSYSTINPDNTAECIQRFLHLEDHACRYRGNDLEAVINARFVAIIIQVNNTDLLRPGQKSYKVVVEDFKGFYVKVPTLAYFLNWYYFKTGGSKHV